MFAPTEPGASVPLSLNRVFFHEITITASYSTTHLETRDALARLVRHRELFRRLITHELPLEKAPEAFRLARESRECLKIVLLSRTP